MTKPGDSKVTVRVEVLVEGGAGGPVKTTVEVTCPPAAKGPQPFLIIFPKPSTVDTSVFFFGGQRCIEASGTSPQVNGNFATKVSAMAFCDPNVTPDQFPTPVPGSATTTCLGDGSWSFSAAKGNPVPGACCDSTPGGANNSTIIVWYQFSDGSISADFTPFHGLCVGSGSGPVVSGSGAVIVGSQLVAPVLHATFTGCLSALRGVALTWNGVTWVGESTHHGGAVLSLSFRGSTFELQSTGPAATFIVAAKPRSFKPFHWSARGKAVGALAGAFEATLTE